MALANTFVELKSVHDRPASSRKIEKGNVDFISQCRMDALDFERFTQHTGIGRGATLFPESSESSQSDLPAWDLAGLPSFVSSVRTCINDVIDAWVRDIEGVCKLTSSYNMNWELKKEKILQKERAIVNVNVQRTK